MTIAEGSAASLRYKFYASGDMDSDTIATRSSDPGNTGGQVLRRVSASLNLKKNATKSQEILASRQVRSSRHTSKRVEGSVSGELSGGTYFDFIEAAHRDTATAGLTKSNTDYTSITADNATSKLTMAGGAPVTDGFRVGDIIALTGCSVAANNRNFVILGFGGTSNRELTVYPAPTDMTADTSFGIARAGLASAPPSSAHVKRKVLFEVNHSDLDMSRVYDECRVTGYRLNVPAEGNATFETMVIGRDRATLTGGSAPFFASPSDETSGNVVNSLEGVLYLNGTKVGLITSLQMNVSLSADAPRVLGQTFPPDVLLGTIDVSGELGFLLDDTDAAASIFENESEVGLIAVLTDGGFAAGQAISIHLPRIKLNSADENVQGEGSQAQQCQFQALLYAGATAGVTASTVRIHDTAAS